MNCILKTSKTICTSLKERIYNEKRKYEKRYDAHHIIENKYGGDNEWWNIHPAAKPQEHQRLIHGKDSPARYLFK